MTSPAYRPTVPPLPTTEWPDLDSWASLVTKTFGKAPDGICEIRIENFSILGFRAIGEVIGVLSFDHDTEEIRIWVSPEFRNIGVASNLLDAAYYRYPIHVEGQEFTVDGAAAVAKYIEWKTRELGD